MLAEKRILVNRFGSCMEQGDEYLFKCPTDKCKGSVNKKLSVNFKKNVFKCWACGYRGNDIAFLVHKYIGGAIEWESKPLITRTFEEIFYGETEQIIQDFLPNDFKPLAPEAETDHEEEAQSFLRSRGIGYRDIIKWRIGYSDEDLWGRIVIPSFNVDGICNYYVARTFKGQKSKYWTPKIIKENIIFNEYDIDWSKDIILVEGVFDAIVAGPNAIPLLGSSFNKRTKLFEMIIKHHSRVYLALDSDKVGLNASYKIAALLYEHGIEVYMVRFEDYNDPGQMSKMEFVVCKEEAKLYNLYDMVIERMMNL